MAKSINHNIKIYSILVTVCLIINIPCFAVQNDNIKREAVIKTASQDIGKFEAVNNTGFTKKYHEVYSKYTGSKLSLSSPYCGLGLFSWYAINGINPNIEFSPRAINWKLKCKKPINLIGISIKDLQNLPVASAVVFKHSYGNHVGLLTEIQGFNLITIEANTSTARSINKYNKKGQGTFKLKTNINNKDLKPISLCDCITQSSNFLKYPL